MNGFWKKGAYLQTIEISIDFPINVFQNSRKHFNPTFKVFKYKYCTFVSSFFQNQYINTVNNSKMLTLTVNSWNNRILGNIEIRRNTAINFRFFSHILTYLLLSHNIFRVVFAKYKTFRFCNVLFQATCRNSIKKCWKLVCAEILHDSVSISSNLMIAKFIYL